MGLPGDPGQPMINGVVEFVGFPKGDKGMQVCWKKKTATRLRVDISNVKQDDPRTVSEVCPNRAMRH